MTDVETFYVELLDSDKLPCKHVRLWFQVGIYAVKADFTLSGICFGYFEGNLEHMNVKKVERERNIIKPRFIFDCVSFVKSVINKGNKFLPTNLYKDI